MKFNNHRIGLAVFASALLMLLVITACSSVDPQELDIPVSIVQREMSPKTIEVKQDDTVTLVVDSDERGDFHLHTYNIEKEVGGASPVEFMFVAEATGRFRIAFHPKEEDHGHGDVFESAELGPGDSFTFEIHEHMAEEMIRFHSHLRPELFGSIMVSDDSHLPADILIEYTEPAASPMDVVAKPGTVITWVNNTSVPQTVVSGRHAEFDAEGRADGHDGKGEHKEEHAEHGEEGEVDLGFLEVNPR